MQDWLNYEKASISEKPCTNPESAYASCCSITKLIDTELEAVLKIMKYSVQPLAYKDSDMKSVMGDFKFLQYETVDEKQMDDKNWNPQIPICTYAGKPDSLDPEQCNLFQASITDDGVGYTFNRYVTLHNST